MDRDEALTRLREVLQNTQFPSNLQEGPRALGRMLDWIDGVLEGTSDELLGVEEDTPRQREIVSAINLLNAIADAVVAGSGHDDFVEALGTEDWTAHPIGDVLAAIRLAMTDELLDASLDEVKQAQENINAERAGLLSAYELSQRDAKHDDAWAAQMVERMTGDKAGINKGGLYPMEIPEGLSVTTQTLRAFQKNATERGLSRVLAAERADTLAVGATHEIATAWRHVSHQGFKNVRVSIQLHFSRPYDRRGDQVEQAILDFTTQDFDMLLVPYKNEQRSWGLNKHVPGLYLTTPKWEAVRSFPVVHELHSIFQGHLAAYENSGYLPRQLHLPRASLAHFLRGGAEEDFILRGEEVRRFLAHPRTVLGAETLEALHEAHPVVFDPEWVDVQEDWEWPQAWAYASRVVLPYDPLYLDFEGPGGTLPFITVGAGKGAIQVPLCGCLFSTDEHGRLTITPMGPRALLDPTYWPRLPLGGTPYEQSGRIIVGGPWTPDENTELAHGEQDTDAFLVTYEGPRGLTDKMAVVNVPSAAAMGVDPAPGYDADACPGYVELPLNGEDATTQLDDDVDSEGRDVSALSRYAACALPAAVKSLSMLSLIDNENVELRPYSVSRQVRRNAARKGIPIASEVVVIRKHRYVDGKRVSESDGHKINYSHQFPVRRHEQHHGPHTPAYRAHPEKAKPCGRCGSCRRFVVESYIKGDPDKPLVGRKTYVFRDNAEVR